jgi:hypothetical protein
MKLSTAKAAVLFYNQSKALIKVNTGRILLPPKSKYNE